MSRPRAVGIGSENDATPGRVAGTTRFILRGLFVASHEDRYAPLLPAGGQASGRQLLLAVGDHWFVRAAGSRIFRTAYLKAVDWILPGIILHYSARKRCLEDWLRQVCDPGQPAGASGCRQVVVLGAGLDTLALRLREEKPGLAFFELDRRPALDIKQATLTAAGSLPASNLTFLPVDLGGGETLGAALGRSPAFDPALSTLFLAEGLLMYLPPEQVASLFREIAALGTPSRPHCFAFTFMEARTDGRIRFRHSNPLVAGWLRRQGEPFRWSHDPDAIPAFLESAGFRLRELASAGTLRARYLDPAGLGDAPLAVGEFLALSQTHPTP